MLASERTSWLSQQQKLEADLAAAKAVVADLQKQVETKAAAARKAESELAGTKSAAASIASSLEVIAQTDKAKGELNNALVAELSELRTKSLDAETRLKELEIAFDKSKSDLDVADAARRALQEEVKRLSDEKDRAVATIAEYVASVGEITKARAGAVGDVQRVAATRNLSATIINVRRGETAPLAEINAGSREGVKAGWVLTIGDGATFIGNLRITEVDVNRAVGVIELEDPATRGEVKVGQRAIARAGE
jgi:chromosome segregation ATPase